MSNKISCEEVMSKLYAYLDSEIDTLTQTDIDEHLHQCRECFSRAEFERALRKKVASAGEVTIPEETRNRMDSLMKRFQSAESEGGQ